MVKVFSSHFSYDYSFPAVSLAFFLRYPNPYSRHVISSDVVSRTLDPVTGRLTTVCLHLKRSKLPAAVLRVLPRSLVGAAAAGPDGTSQTFVLESSTVDVGQGWMHTESRNLEWTGVLSVIERQHYRPSEVVMTASSAVPWSDPTHTPGRTDVESTVTLHSPLGEAQHNRWKQRRAAAAVAAVAAAAPSGGIDGLDDHGGIAQRVTDAAYTEPAAVAAGSATEPAPSFRAWTTASLRRTIESFGVRRAARSQPNAREGMEVVLGRLRHGGLVAALEGMRRDRDLLTGGGRSDGGGATSGGEV